MQLKPSVPEKHLVTKLSYTTLLKDVTRLYKRKPLMHLQGRGPMTFREGKRRKKDLVLRQHQPSEATGTGKAPQNNRPKTLSRYPLVSHTVKNFTKEEKVADRIPKLRQSKNKGLL